MSRVQLVVWWFGFATSSAGVIAAAITMTFGGWLTLYGAILVFLDMSYVGYWVREWKEWHGIGPMN